MTKVTTLGAKAGDAKMYTPEQTLTEVLNERIGKDGAFKNAKKLLVLALDDTDGDYAISWQQAGMRMSECALLCEISKDMFKHKMGF